MMRTPIRMFTILCILLFAAPSWGANFEKGRTALHNGDYEIALIELVPLAEQGNV